MKKKYDLNVKDVMHMFDGVDICMEKFEMSKKCLDLCKKKRPYKFALDINFIDIFQNAIDVLFYEFSGHHDF